jgi:hypothetical protein
MSPSDRRQRAGKIRVVLKGAIVLPESRSPVEIMRTMNISPFPKPVEISDIESLTNARLKDANDLIARTTKPIFIHADGGVGKTVFVSSLAAAQTDAYEVVVFDCFGGGA